MTNPVLRAISNPLGDPALDVFLHWCDLKGVRPMPLAPADIATFVMQSQALGIEKIAATVAAISKTYLARGYADPTAGGPVGAALNAIAPIDPPRSWPKEHKHRFTSMPYDLQAYVASHEARREKVVRQAQNEAGVLRNTFDDIQRWFCWGPAYSEAS
ncbi:hypothetical protein V1292_005131 [Bradyrhizobium sp. AZCC 1719]|uniref:hypothetical protein n=1 Tax=Bradyrhizobium sp. AZCC 1719 TaxID=3117028 RepID=UPI002FEFAD7B